MGFFLYTIFFTWLLIFLSKTSLLSLFGVYGFSITYMISYFIAPILFLQLAISIVLLIIILLFRSKVCAFGYVMKITLYTLVTAAAMFPFIPPLTLVIAIIPFLASLIGILGLIISFIGLRQFSLAYHNEYNPLSRNSL